MVSAVRSALDKASQKFRESYVKWTRREKILVLFTTAFVLYSVSYFIYEPVQRALVDQEQRLSNTSQQMQYVSAALARYQKLRQHREQIEKQFKEVAIEEGGLAYLEDLVKTKAGVLNPQISPRDTKEFGADYEQVPFLVRFPIVDLARLVQFLDELVDGKKPFILASLDIKRRPAGDSLDIELEVSTIRSKKSS